MNITLNKFQETLSGASRIQNKFRTRGAYFASWWLMDLCAAAMRSVATTTVANIIHSLIIDHFSDSVTAMGLVCLCVYLYVLSQ